MTYDSTCYYATDALYSVVAMLSDTNGTPVEHVRYLPYGTARHHRAADIDGDGDTDSNDGSVILNVWGATIGTANYTCEADLNRDGVVNGTDYSIVLNDIGPALAAGQVSAVDNPIAFAGYVFNESETLYTVRNRTFSTDDGRWIERDPAGYTDGSGLYEYVSMSPALLSDPYGNTSQWLPPEGFHNCMAHYWDVGKSLGISEECLMSAGFGTEPMIECCDPMDRNITRGPICNANRLASLSCALPLIYKAALCQSPQPDVSGEEPPADTTPLRLPNGFPQQPGIASVTSCQLVCDSIPNLKVSGVCSLQGCYACCLSKPSNGRTSDYMPCINFSLVCAGFDAIPSRWWR